MKLIKSSGIIALCIMLSYCTQKNDDNPQPGSGPGPVTETKMGSVGLHLHYYIGDEEILSTDPDVPANTAGRKIAFAFGQLYLSDFEFIMADGKQSRLSDTVILKKATNPTYFLGKIPVGNYKGFRFKVGLQPTKDTTSSIPSLNDPAMLFTGNARQGGHIFFHFRGKIDTTAGAIASDDELQPFTYKLGTSERLIAVNSLPATNVNVLERGVEYFHIVLDVNKIFTGIDLRDPSNLSVINRDDNSKTVAGQIANNISNSFRIESGY